MKCSIKKLFLSPSVPQLLGWKELPTETPLISAYFKLFGQELAYININKEVLQQAVKVPGPPALFAIPASVPAPHAHSLAPCFPAGSAGARGPERAAEEGGGPAACRRCGTMDAAAVAGRAALHRPHRHRAAPGVQLLQHRPGQGCCQRWALSGHGRDGAWARLEKGGESQEVRKRASPGIGEWGSEDVWRGAGCTGLCIVFEWIEDARGEMSTWEIRGREAATFKAKKPQELPGEPMQTWAEGGGSWEVHTQAKEESMLILKEKKIENNQKCTVSSIKKEKEKRACEKRLELSFKRTNMQVLILMKRLIQWSHCELCSKLKLGKTDSNICWHHVRNEGWWTCACALPHTHSLLVFGLLVCFSNFFADLHCVFCAFLLFFSITTL